MSDNPESEKWRAKAHYCNWSSAPEPHQWIPIAWTVSDKAKHVSTMMCGKCFHEINISEAFRHRIKI